MSLFSERYGHKSIKDIMQLDDINDDLRNSLWNSIFLFYFPRLEKNIIEDDSIVIIKKICVYVIKQPLDTLPQDPLRIFAFFRQKFFSAMWYEVYDFIEFFIRVDEDTERKRLFINFTNEKLSLEYSGYRVVSGQLVRVTNEQEVESIEHAIQKSPKPVQIHMQRAIELFADRQNPDYRNSIKESISAVEAICSQIVGDPKATLGQALKKIDEQVQIHKALVESYSKLYGYTSDSSGIRHALLDEPNLSSEDAKFMLVSCSAFINYLLEKAAKAGINL